MQIETAKKAAELLEEIEALSKFKDIVANRDHGTSVANFALRLHYNPSSSEMVVFGHKYTHLFLPVAEAIVKELQAELDAL